MDIKTLIEDLKELETYTNTHNVSISIDNQLKSIDRVIWKDNCIRIIAKEDDNIW